MQKLIKSIFVVALLGVFTYTPDARAVLITISSDTLWSAITTGSGTGGQPNNNDTITVNNGATLTVNVASTSNATVGAIQLGGTTKNSGNGTLLFNSNSQVTVAGTVTLGNGNRRGSITMTSGGTLILASFTVDNLGAWTPGTGTVQFTATNTIPASFTTFNNLFINGGTTTLDANTTVNGSLTVAPAATLNTAARRLDVSGNFVINGTLSGTGAITLLGPTAANIDGTGSVTNTARFNVAGPKTVLAAANLTIAGQINVTGQVTNNGTLTSASANGIIGGGVWQNNANSILNVAGNLSVGTFTATASPNTVNYNGSANQTVKATTYHHLVITKPAGTIATVGNLTTVNGNLTVTSGTLDARDTFTVNGSGSVTGMLEHGSNTGVKTYKGLVTINPGGAWTNSSNDDITFQGGLTNNGSFTSGTGTYTFNTNNQAINGTNPVTFSRDIQIALDAGGINGITLTNNTTVTVVRDLLGSAGNSTWLNAVNSTLNIGRALLDTGTLNATANPNTVNYNGTANQTAKGLAYHNLTVTKAGGNLTLAGDTTVAGVLTLTQGNIVTGANTLILTSTAACNVSAVRTSGHVAGNLRRYIPAGTTIACTFDIGDDSTTYTPVALVFDSVGTAGNLTAATTIGDHSAVTTPIPSTNINALRSVNRFWTLTNNSVVFTGDYDITLTFVNSDIDTDNPPVDPGEFIMQRYVTTPSPTWIDTSIVSALPLSTQAKGNTGFGDFAVGESLTPNFSREKEFIYTRELY